MKNDESPRAWPPRPIPRVASLSTAQLISGLSDELRQLIRTEIDLAKAEVRMDLAAEKKTAVWLGLAAVALLVFVNMLFVAAALWLAQSVAPPAAALLVAGGLLALALVFGLIARASLKTPLEATRKTLQETWTWAKNRVA